MTATEPAAGRRHPLSHRSAYHHGEVRWAASAAVLLAAASHAALPNELLALPRWVMPAVEVALLIPLVAINPHRLTTADRRARVIGIVLSTVVIVTNLVSLGFLVHALVEPNPTDGRALLLAGLQVWLTDIIAFALVYWELDRGGAVARLPASRLPAGRKDFLFPQDDDSTGRATEWFPLFTDYLYVSLTNSTAFSPTDTLPVTTRAKALMAAQALIALVTALLVVARAVNILG